MLVILEAVKLFVGGEILLAILEIAVFAVVFAVLSAARVDEQIPVTINVTGKPPSNRRDLKRFIKEVLWVSCVGEQTPRKADGWLSISCFVTTLRGNPLLLKKIP